MRKRGEVMIQLISETKVQLQFIQCYTCVIKPMKYSPTVANLFIKKKKSMCAIALSVDIKYCFVFFQAWSPALRDGIGWQEYLTFSFNSTARISALRIGTPTSIGNKNFRSVFKVRIEVSSNCHHFTPVLESAIPVDNIIRFAKTLIASNLKIIFIGVDPTNADASPIGING
jgi:hypothetical protein